MSISTTSADPASLIRKHKICYLCGLLGADTTEHVLPRCLYPNQKKLPDNVLTLPAHLECNRQTAKDEEAFRDFISPSLASHEVGHSLWDRTWRGIHRPAAARYQATYYRSIISRFERDDCGKRVAVPLATTLQAERVHWVLAKIVKGLFTAMTGELIPNSQVCWDFGLFTTEKDAKDGSACLPQSRMLHDVLSIQWGRAFDEPLATLWVLGFYGTQFFWVETTPKNRQGPADCIQEPSRIVWPNNSFSPEALSR